MRLNDWSHAAWMKMPQALPACEKGVKGIRDMPRENSMSHVWTWTPYNFEQASLSFRFTRLLIWLLTHSFDLPASMTSTLVMLGGINLAPQGLEQRH